VSAKDVEQSVEEVGRWLDFWDENIYQRIYSPRGFSRDTALLHWYMVSADSAAKRSLEELKASMRPPDDEWKDKL
jgi:hypothetical protein